MVGVRRRRFHFKAGKRAACGDAPRMEVCGGMSARTIEPSPLATTESCAVESCDMLAGRGGSETAQREEDREWGEGEWQGFMVRG